jgi:hypothetical protein
MDLDAALIYPADPGAAFTMLANPAFVQRKAVATGTLSHEASVLSRPDGGATISLTRVWPAQVPDFVRPFLGQTVEVRQTDVWGTATADGARTGTMQGSIAGVPASISATMTLVADGGLTTHRIQAVIKVGIPLIGAKIEQAIAEIVMRAVRKEGEVGVDWLSGA